MSLKEKKRERKIKQETKEKMTETLKNMNKAITPIENQSFQTVVFDPRVLNRLETWEDHISAFIQLKEYDFASNWLKGDIANRVTVKYGENSLGEFAKAVGSQRTTVDNYRRVSRAFDFTCRQVKVSWWTFAVASYADKYNKKSGKFVGERRFEYIKKADDESWSSRQLAQVMKKENVIAETNSVFQYYFDYLTKLENILLHIEKNRLTEQEKQKLAEKLVSLYKKFSVYLKI